MANANTDLTEEDAADLQFPKAPSNRLILLKENMLQLNSIDEDCLHCTCDLGVPYIICNVCDAKICCVCFANGAEFGEHRNDHDYIMCHNNETLFEGSDWTTNEELVLINTLKSYGNFDFASQFLGSRSLEQVKDHYDRFYIDRKGSDQFPAFSQIETPIGATQITPYRLRSSNDPPRYTSNSPLYHTLAGYNAARSDFELEYDPNAEELIADLKFVPVEGDDPSSELMADLQCAMVRSYNRRLLERRRRKLVIRNHGLIVHRKMTSWLHRFDVTVTKRVYERLCKFAQFCNGMQFEYIMEGLHRAGELKMEISRLLDFHKQGITTIPAAKLYVHIKATREETLANLRAFHNSVQLNSKIRSSLSTILPSATKKRGVFSPLDIVGLPGYEKLTPKEQDLCRNVRLVPQSYLQFREVLIEENQKFGHLKLQSARRLLKIDVNKTRKLYDFLIEEGFINKQ